MLNTVHTIQHVVVMKYAPPEIAKLDDMWITVATLLDRSMLKMLYTFLYSTLLFFYIIQVKVTWFLYVIINVFLTQLCFFKCLSSKLYSDFLRFWVSGVWIFWVSLYQKIKSDLLFLCKTTFLENFCLRIITINYNQLSRLKQP